jgi:hypothetical protein
LDNFDNSQLRYRLGMTGDVEFDHWTSQSW